MVAQFSTGILAHFSISIYTEGPLQELYDVLHGNGTAEEIRECIGKVTGQGETIIRLARKEMDRTVWEE